MASAILRQADRLDPITATFGVHGLRRDDAVVEVALGGLRGMLRAPAAASGSSPGAPRPARAR
jgi:hypothetical protein